MPTEPTTEDLLHAEARDPYGDVALGVECAWPENIPPLDAADAEAE